MKLKTITFAAMLLALGVFVACNSDDENIYGGLDASSLIGRTKAAPTDDMGDIDDWFDNPNLQIPHEANCCGLYALTKRYIDVIGTDAFTRPIAPLRADSIYYRMKSSIESLNLEMNEDGSMPLGTMMELSQQYGTSDAPLYGEVVHFDSEHTPQDYLNVSANRENAAALIMIDQDGNEHVAHVSSAHSNYMEFDGYNGATDNYNGGSVYFNNHGSHLVNNQYYQIIGVLTKQ